MTNQKTNKSKIPEKISDAKNVNEQIGLKKRYDQLQLDYENLKSKVDDYINLQDSVSKRVEKIESDLCDDNVYGGVNALLEYKKTHRELPQN